MRVRLRVLLPIGSPLAMHVEWPFGASRSKEGLASLRVLQRELYTRIISDSFSVLALLTLRLRQTFLSYSETAAGNGTTDSYCSAFYRPGCIRYQ